MATIQQLLQYLMHIDDTLLSFVSLYGYWTYGLLFLIIFCETGLVIFPFLPGDSLLFAAGSIAAQATANLNILFLFIFLTIASIVGNKVNYLLGRRVGPHIFAKENTWLFNKKHLHEAHQFYLKHGGKTIIIARFLPIIRTFVPFVAGIGAMGLAQFTFYNVFSAILWIGSLLAAGYFLGSLAFVQQNFSIIVYLIIGFSILPPIMTLLYKKLSADKIQ